MEEEKVNEKKDLISKSVNLLSFVGGNDCPFISFYQCKNNILITISGIIEYNFIDKIDTSLSLLKCDGCNTVTRKFMVFDFNTYLCEICFELKRFTRSLEQYLENKKKSLPIDI